jgi:cell wall-associated NlpC family hydrolase
VATTGVRALVGAQSLASVPVAAAWTLDIPAITVVTDPVPAPADEASPAEDPAPPAGDAAPPDDPDKADPPAPVDKRDKAEKPDKAEKADKAEKPSKATQAKKSAKAEAAATADEVGSAVLEVASRYVGVPYLYGGNTPSGFDCSGFTQYVFGQLGVDLPHQSERQRFKGREVSRSEAKPGDLIWVPGHVSIYVGGNKMIDSARVGTTVQFRRMWQSNPTFIRVVG